MAACHGQTAREKTINNRSSFVIDIPILHCSRTAAVTSDYATLPIHYLSTASRFQPNSLALFLAYVNQLLSSILFVPLLSPLYFVMFPFLKIQLLLPLVLSVKTLAQMVG
jgi:hypothetical protein